MHKHKAKCDICGSPVWIISSREGTSHYEPRISDREAKLEKELAEYKAAEASLFGKESRRIFGALRKKAREEAINEDADDAERYEAE